MRRLRPHPGLPWACRRSGSEVSLLAIVGPTASGKSSLAVTVAHLLGAAEVIGTDSMQVYRGMDIGTATPTQEERGGVRHRMVDVWEPSHVVSVAEFQQHARREIDEVLTASRIPIVVGGSGLFVSAVLDDLRFPGTDPQVRARLESELEEVGAAEMHRRLTAVDPEAAAVILPSNGRRVVRALEVIELTGEPFRATLPEPVDVYPTVRVGLDIPRPELDARIEARVYAMWEAGFVDEVRLLAASGLEDAPTASRALGYQEILRHLAGEWGEDEARRRTIEATRRFARRQQRWFRRDQRIQWLRYDSKDLAAEVLDAWESGTVT
jgi:tRNA dimethylallyltransferase